MRRKLRRIGLVAVVTIGIVALGVDIYLDAHPEVLKKFMAEHPAIFPVSPWWAYLVAGITLVAFVLLLPRLFGRDKSRRDDDMNR